VRSRSQRGVAFPSPVAILSVIAVAMAGIAYVATQGEEPTEREVTTVSRPAATQPEPVARQPIAKRKQKPIEPRVVRSEVYVEVYNNSGITGLAGGVAERAQAVGWRVVGADNWYGTVPGSTVYFPERLKAAGEQLALDLGIDRVLPAIPSMTQDRLTVVLTSDAA
jgi:hypothetical protein